MARTHRAQHSGDVYYIEQKEDPLENHSPVEEIPALKPLHLKPTCQFINVTVYNRV